MHYVTVQTLAFAISALVFDRCRLIDKINHVSPEVEEDEHLADTLFAMDKSLGELADLYAHACKVEGAGLDFELLYSNAESEYTRYKREMAC